MRIALCTLIFMSGFLAGVNFDIRPDYVQESWKIFASIFWAFVFTGAIVDGK